MDELLKMRAWIDTLKFSFPDWVSHPEDDPEQEQIQWLALRDAPAFDSQWMRVWKAVEAQEIGAPLTEAENSVLEEIRESGFSKVIDSDSVYVNELAEYASDDFDLLARAARVGFSDFWIDKLRAEYKAGRFPHGTL